jgi:hypothetical protein
VVMGSRDKRGNDSRNAAKLTPEPSPMGRFSLSA